MEGKFARGEHGFEYRWAINLAEFRVLCLPLKKFGVWTATH